MVSATVLRKGRFVRKGRLLAGWLIPLSLLSQEPELLLPAKPLPLSLPLSSVEDLSDPLAVPPELGPIMRRAAARDWTTRSKLQGILDIIFRPVKEGGLGITYDNSRTRTIQEVLRDHQANCISLTALYVASCRVAGLPAHYSEPVNLNHWRREAGIIRMERHVVALISLFPQDDLVADFLPQLRKHQGTYLVRGLSEERMRSLYYSNRSVELLTEGDYPNALKHSEQAVKADPTCGVAWNIRGVVMKYLNRPGDSESSYMKALFLDPRDSAAIGNMEAFLRETGRTAEAQTYRLLGLEVRAKDPYFQAFLASEAMDSEQWDEASKRVNLAIKLLPYESDFYLIRAQLDLQAGKPDKAIHALDLARRWALPAERERYDTKLALLKKSQP